MRRGIVIMVGCMVSACSGTADDGCQATRDHIAGCYGVASAQLQVCDPNSSEQLLAMSCAQIDSALTTPRADKDCREVAFWVCGVSDCSAADCISDCIADYCSPGCDPAAEDCSQ